MLVQPIRQAQDLPFVRGQGIPTGDDQRSRSARFTCRQSGKSALPQLPCESPTRADGQRGVLQQHEDLADGIEAARCQSGQQVFEEAVRELRGQAFPHRGRADGIEEVGPVGGCPWRVPALPGGDQRLLKGHARRYAKPPRQAAGMQKENEGLVSRLFFRSAPNLGRLATFRAGSRAKLRVQLFLDGPCDGGNQIAFERRQVHHAGIDRQPFDSQVAARRDCPIKDGLKGRQQRQLAEFGQLPLQGEAVGLRPEQLDVQELLTNEVLLCARHGLP
jgi:hypothetical protein